MVPSLFQTSHAVIDTSPCGQDKSRCADPEIPLPEDQADPILVREPKVNDQNIEPAINREPLRRLAFCCRLHLIISFLKR